jgi:peptide/nickel transport system permease protein
MRWLFGRVLQALPVLFTVSILTFLMIHAIPGDPGRLLLGVRATPQAVAALDHEFGLDRPLLVQYPLYLQRLLRGDLGESIFYQQPVATLLVSRMSLTAALLAYSALLSVCLSFPLALLAATHHNRLLDQIVRLASLTGLALPPFWLGIMLILILGLDIPIFPVGGYGQDFAGHVVALFLPSLTIAISISPSLIRVLRVSILDVLQADFVLTAHSKGVSDARVMIRHVLPNALLPAITVLGLNVGFLVGGAFVVENVFALPGAGALLVDSIATRDFPVVQGTVLVFTLLVVVVYIVTDLGYRIADPRVKLT